MTNSLQQFNCIGIRVAEGWFSDTSSPEAFDSKRYVWGTTNSVLAQPEVAYSDGSRETVVTDDTWKVREGPIRLAEICNGEKYDSSYKIPGWSSVDCGSEGWLPIKILEQLPPETSLVAQTGPPMRSISTRAPVDLLTTPSGKTIIDFGQNLVGYVRVKKVTGPKGAVLSFRHAEVLEDREIGIRPLLKADQLDQYTLKGDVEESWEPRFIYHGFRFVEIQGWPSEISGVLLQSVEAVICSSDMKAIQHFTCYDPAINRLHENIIWSLIRNFTAVPKDCPQRDERLGWTGDIALSGPNAAYLSDCYGMLARWLKDVSYDQEALWGVPAWVTPNVLKSLPLVNGSSPTAVWDDVVILLPWALFNATGDSDVLFNQYQSVKIWLQCIPRNSVRATRLWESGLFQWGASYRSYEVRNASNDYRIG